SVAAPLSFMLDFGIAGVWVLSILTGVLLRVSYGLYVRKDGGVVGRCAYVLLLLNAFWSIRAGAFILSPGVVYSVIALVVCSRGGAGLSSRLRGPMRIAFVGVVALAGLTLFARL
ncbi:MAG: hypothetical protein WAL50_08565, partial [Kineosporiaceae bacterium]